MRAFRHPPLQAIHPKCLPRICSFCLPPQKRFSVDSLLDPRSGCMYKYMYESCEWAKPFYVDGQWVI